MVCGPHCETATANPPTTFGPQNLEWRGLKLSHGSDVGAAVLVGVDVGEDGEEITESTVVVPGVAVVVVVTSAVVVVVASVAVVVEVAAVVAITGAPT